MMLTESLDLPMAILDILPNPVLVKDSELRYVWVNAAFEDLFGVDRSAVLGRRDPTVFKDRQAVQCNGGDRRVLESGLVDEAYETVFRGGTEPRETITRKSRLLIGENAFLVGIIHDVTEVTNANRELEEKRALLEAQSDMLREMAYTDPLTGIMNRRRLAENAPVAFGTHRNNGAAIVCDLDHFKRINDSMGHDAGDAALRHFVIVAESALRDGDLIARTGGEEFAILLPGIGAHEAMEIAERVRTSLELSPLEYEGTRIDMTVSLGVTELTGQDFDLDALLSAADKCLYRAKAEGRNRTVIAA